MSYPEYYESASLTSRVWAITILRILEFENESELMYGSWVEKLGMND